ncbi:hypothetical protein [Kitasatospora sp. NPDC004289]
MSPFEPGTGWGNLQTHDGTNWVPVTGISEITVHVDQPTTTEDLDWPIRHLRTRRPGLPRLDKAARLAIATHIARQETNR